MSLLVLLHKHLNRHNTLQGNDTVTAGLPSSLAFSEDKSSLLLCFQFSVQADKSTNGNRSISNHIDTVSDRQFGN